MEVGRIVVLNGEDQDAAFLLKNLSVFEAGRSQGNHILLTDSSVAMSHFRICRNGNQYQIYDLGSRHGTIVNNSPIEKIDLQVGDRIQAGEILMQFDLVDAATPGELASSAPRVAEAAKPEASEAEPGSTVVSHGMHATLRLLEGEGKGKVFKLVGKTFFTIGRSTKADMRLKDGKVSRIHCHLERVGDHFVIKDNDSANGTIVNGDVIQKTILKDGDYIRLGFSIILFRLSCGT